MCYGKSFRANTAKRSGVLMRKKKKLCFACMQTQRVHNLSLFSLLWLLLTPTDFHWLPLALSKGIRSPVRLCMCVRLNDKRSVSKRFLRTFLPLFFRSVSLLFTASRVGLRCRYTSVTVCMDADIVYSTNKCKEEQWKRWLKIFDSFPFANSITILWNTSLTLMYQRHTYIHRYKRSSLLQRKANQEKKCITWCT